MRALCSLLGVCTNYVNISLGQPRKFLYMVYVSATANIWPYIMVIIHRKTGSFIQCVTELIMQTCITLIQRETFTNDGCILGLPTILPGQSCGLSSFLYNNLNQPVTKFSIKKVNYIGRY